MKQEETVLRAGAAAIAFALLLRLCGGGLWEDVQALLAEPSIPAVLLYAETGRVFSLKSEETVPETTEKTQPETTAPQRLQLSAQDADRVAVTDKAGANADVQAMVVQPLDWHLTDPEPTVLILHTHTCESYENTEGYTPSASYRTEDTRYNMISVGEALAQKLRDAGIGVIHDTQIHDYDYTAAYTQSREATQAYLAKYPSVQVVLDLHRDAYTDGQGNQASSTVKINGEECSRLMFLVGTNGGGEYHPNWRENVSMAVKLQAVLEGMYPGLCRPMIIRYSRYNQDLSPGAILVEVGTAGDERQEALNAVSLLGDALIALSQGAN